MTNMLETIVAKSDQLNSDDIIGHSITIKITNVSKVTGDQPISINYEGDNGKPWKPCKSMRRMLVAVWGYQGKDYIGRSLTLYRDPTVKFANMEVGGIRISHMSHIDKPITVALTNTRASKKPFTVQPLSVGKQSATTAPQDTFPGDDKIDHMLEALKLNARSAALSGLSHLESWFKELPKESQVKIKPHLEEYKTLAKEMEK